MMKSLPLFGLVVLALAACGDKSNETPPNSAAASATASTSGTLPETANLKIYNWSDYVDPATVAAFEKQYGVAVKYDYYDSDETLESKMLTGKSGYDLAGSSNAFIGRQIKAGAYQKLDKSLIPNYKNINPKLLALMQEVDPGNDYAVPFFWGTNTFAINTERVKKALGTDKLPDNQWDLVFNPEYTAKLKQCGISYLDSAAEVYPMVLNYMGKNPNSSNLDDIKAASELLKQNRPNIKRFTSSGFIDDLARGDTCVTIGFGGDLNIAKRRAEEAEKERQRALRREQNPDGITDNVSKKKIRQQEKEAAEKAARAYEAKKNPVQESEEKKPLSGDPERPYSRGRAYDPAHYGRKRPAGSDAEQTEE